MTSSRLFHVSERPDITLFEPRQTYEGHPLGPEQPVVWAIAERLLHNYLLPRDCPRVTFYPRPNSDPADVARLMGQTSARHIVAVEWDQLPAIRAAVLYLYEIPPTTFVDPTAARAITSARRPLHPSPSAGWMISSARWRRETSNCASSPPSGRCATRC